MVRWLLLLLVLGGMLLPLGCSSDDDDDPPPPPPASFGPSAIAGGDDALLMVTGDFLTWTEVLQTTSGITATGDIMKIAKVPGHPNNRLVAIVSRDDTTDSNAEIWYGDNGGTGTWTEATLTLDLQHQEGTTGQDDDWELRDIFFVDQYEGYAVGNEWVVLRTVDGGATWTDMNMYQDGTGTINFQELDLNTVVGSFTTGDSITGNGGGAGTVIAFHAYATDPTIIVDVSGGTAFVQGTDTSITDGGTNTANMSTVTNALWRYYARESLCIWVDVATDGTHTIYLGQDGNWYFDSENGIPGVWKIVSNATMTPASRTFSWSQPMEQRGTGEIGEASNDVRDLYFLDANTGVAGTGDGVWFTEGGTGVSWGQFTGSNNLSYYDLCYSRTTTTTSGYIYGIEDVAGTELPGRVAVTYTAGTWDLDDTNGWVQHGDPTRYSVDNIEYSVSIFPYSDNKIFAYDYGSISTADWGWGRDVNNANIDLTLWQDCSENYIGGTATNVYGVNTGYNKGVLDGTSAPTGTIRCITRR